MNLYAIPLAAAVAFGAAWTAQNWRYGEIINDTKFEQSEAARKIFESAQRQHELDIEQKDRAINEANLRAQKFQIRASALDSDVDGVRLERDAARAALSQASADAVRHYSDALGDVYGACTARLVEVAKYSTQCASDLRLMQDAWPD